MNTALITGASSGIGYELAKVMAIRGHDLVLVARDEDRLRDIQSDFTKQYNIAVRIVSRDLSEPGAAKLLYDELQGVEIDILVNNAGVGLKGNFFDDVLSDNQRMAYLNMNSLMDMTYYFGGAMVRRNRGKILNTASITAFFPGPKQPVYYATKSFVRSFSRALAYSLRNTGVTVTALHPGITKTNFFNTAKAAGQTKGASPASVAETGYSAMMAGKIEVTHGVWNKLLTNVFARITPYRIQPIIIDRASDV